MKPSDWNKNSRSIRKLSQSYRRLNIVNLINPDGLRYADEFVRHKVLDALGDFCLAGLDLQGIFRLHRSGHDLHIRLLDELFSDPSNYVVLEPGFEEETSLSKIPAYSRAAAY